MMISSHLTRPLVPKESSVLDYLLNQLRSAKVEHLLLVLSMQATNILRELLATSTSHLMPPRPSK